MYNFLQHLFFHKYLERSEKVIMVIHRHIWIVWRKFVFKIIVFIIIPCLIYYFFQHKYVMFVVIPVVIFGVLSFYHSFIDWYLDVLILTDRNLINFHWNGLFNRDSIRIDYQDIESISVHDKGIAQTIFKFGELKIETANEALNASLPHARNVYHAQAQILEMKKKLENENINEELQVFKKALGHFMEEYKKG